MRLPAAVLVVSFACGLAGVARAGGGPENVFLVVNPASADSLTVANTFTALRQVPAHLAQLTQLASLCLSSNGTLEGGWQHLPAQLTGLQLINCNLQQVPAELADLARLNYHVLYK